jgi:hypothetical protein
MDNKGHLYCHGSLLRFFIPHQTSSDDDLVFGGIFPTLFLSQITPFSSKTWRKPGAVEKV